jgi:predicted secreted protein
VIEAQQKLGFQARPIQRIWFFLGMIIPFAAPTSVAIFLTIWFIVLFAVLPFGVRSQTEKGEVAAGTDPGAPVAPRLLAKAIWTTVLSAVVFACLVFVVGWLGP